ncbi:Crp/Fnr family transcriptional regulator [Streptomyces griseoluteus]|uniref:Crp/Fnr family transcriptional regulator n=1 Tax=Streptomyces griseoluteus TaxID=29306 RepID=A0A4Z1D5F4_STRGP|nr:Crp/Fnr family transcriptional regulator [Streptomyces griseoluteus]TGN76949.1 Crp/Fnr family transcriptional regulator [Streptomyces griseoluteus]GHF28053.1 Crp/Fnr family transcriptional regulator [Streptomyces griseoluteus]
MTYAASRDADPESNWPRGSYLGRLTEAALEDLLTLGRPRRFDAKDLLVRQGDTDRHSLLLLTGFTKVTATAQNGRESLLAIRLGGDIIGEMAAVGAMPRTATVTACGPVTARAVPHETLRAFLLRRPDAAVELTGIVSERLRWANNRRLEFRGYNVKERLARILVDLAASHGRPGRDGVELGFTLTQPELAALTGAAEPTVHKALKELRDAELIVTGYRTTTVLDLDLLREEARLLPSDLEGGL